MPIIFLLVGLVVVVVIALVVVRALGSSGPPGLGAGQRVGTRGWEAALTLDPLGKTIAARKQELASETDEQRRDRLTREIAFLEQQIPQLQALVAARDASPGLGYMGFKQLPPD